MIYVNHAVGGFRKKLAWTSHEVSIGSSILIDDHRFKIAYTLASFLHVRSSIEIQPAMAFQPEYCYDIGDLSVAVYLYTLVALGACR